MPPRIGEVYTRGHADARAARPRGADRRRQPARPGAARRRLRQRGVARALPGGPRAGRRGAPALAGHRRRLAGAVRAARGHRPASQAVPGQAVLTEERSPVQTPAPFEYERATSVEGAIASLERLGPEARIIAGGHSLLPMMKLRLAQPAHLIDINDLTDLAYIREDEGMIKIGAMTRHVDLLKSDLLARTVPAVPRRRGGHRRPGGAQPRHDRRLAVPGRRGRGPLGGVQRREGVRGDPRQGRRARRSRWRTSTSART